MNMRKLKKTKNSNKTKECENGRIGALEELTNQSCRGTGPSKKGNNYSSLSPIKPTPVYDTFWRFAHERQSVFFKKLEQPFPPWTNDPILSEYKFTNVYRATDRVSQYLIKEVIYNGEQSAEEVFFRIILFKLFNKIETWELLKEELGCVTYAEFNFRTYDTILTDAMQDGHRLYSAAYIMSPGNNPFGYSRKHRNHLRLVENLLKDKVPHRIGESKSMQMAFDILRSYPMVGDFLAYQFVIDINYSNLMNFSEDMFVVPGPGCRDGIRKCFYDLGHLNEAEIIKLMVDRQAEEFNRLGLAFKTLWGRPLKLIDCQNVFCEVDKYSRIAHPQFKGISGRNRIKQKYRPNLKSIHYWFPPKWKINERIPSNKG